MTEGLVWEIGTWLALASCPGIVLFWALYAFRSHWWSTSAGWVIFALYLSLTMMVALAVALYFFGGNYPGRPWYRLVALGVLFVSAWGALIVLAREQRKDRRR